MVEKRNELEYDPGVTERLFRPRLTHKEMLDVERCRSEGDLSIGIEEVMGDNSKRKRSIIERGDVSDTISKKEREKNNRLSETN